MNKGCLGSVLIGSILVAIGFTMMLIGFGGSTRDTATKPITVPVAINEFAVDRDGVAFCVTKVENLKSIGSGYSEVTTENNFVVVTITIFNNGTEPYDVNASRFVLMNGEIEYQHDSDAVWAIDNGMFLDTINPGISKEYTLAYETPMEMQEGDFQLKIKYHSFIESACVYISFADAK